MFGNAVTGASGPNETGADESLRTIALLVFAASIVRGALTLSIPVMVLHGYRTVRFSHNGELFVVLFGAIVSVHLLQGLLRLWRLRLLRRLADRIDQTYRSRATSDAWSVSAPTERSPQHRRDLDTLRNFIVGDGMALMMDLPWVAAFVGMLFFVNIWLVVVCVLFAGIIGCLAASDERSSRAFAQIIEAADAQLRTPVDRDPLHRAFIPSSRLNPAAVPARQQAHTRLSTASRPRDLMRVLLQTVKSIQVVVVIGVATYLYVETHGSIGMMMISAFLAPRISEPIDALSRRWPAMPAAYAAWSRIRQTPRQPNVDKEPECPKVHRSAALLAVEHLSLVTANEKRLLRDVSFELAPGSILTIVGPTACGKTALANVCAGCLSPRSGTVSFRGESLTELSDERRLTSIGYIPQRVTFYRGSVAENLSRFNPVIDEEEIQNLLEMLGLGEWCGCLPDGLATDFGRIPDAPTPGIRQKLAIVRAMYQAPPILICDEPALYLDDLGQSVLSDMLARQQANGAGILILTANSGHPSVTGERAAIEDSTLTASCIGRQATRERPGVQA